MSDIPVIEVPEELFVIARPWYGTPEMKKVVYRCSEQGRTYDVEAWECQQCHHDYLLPHEYLYGPLHVCVPEPSEEEVQRAVDIGLKALNRVLPICGVLSYSGPNREPLACGWRDNHDGPHSWSTLPTFPAT